MPSISIPQALQRGFVMVYGLFFPFIIGIPLVFFWLSTVLPLPDFLLLLSVPLGMLAAWGWWSYRVPQWRLWALQHVDDIDTLHQRAVQTGIAWSYGSIFERTEIKSYTHTQQEAHLQLQYYLRCTQSLLPPSDEGYPSAAPIQTYHLVIEHLQSYLAAGVPIPAPLLDDLDRMLPSIAELCANTQAEQSWVNALVGTAYAARKYRRSAYHRPT